MPTPDRIAVSFPSQAWETDLALATSSGKLEANKARESFAARGIPIRDLRPCTDPGQDGTRLPACYKVYLPAPVGRFGMVFQLGEDDNGDDAMFFLAFGVRHHPKGSHALTVYQRAHNRLWADAH